MRGFSGFMPATGTDKTPSLDITYPDGPVVIEIDRNRDVLYVHMEGVTVLRVCGIQKFVLQTKFDTDDEEIHYFKTAEDMSILEGLSTAEIIHKLGSGTPQPYFFDPRD